MQTRTYRASVFALQRRFPADDPLAIGRNPRDTAGVQTPGSIGRPARKDHSGSILVA